MIRPLIQTSASSTVRQVMSSYPLYHHSKRIHESQRQKYSEVEPVRHDVHPIHIAAGQCREHSLLLASHLVKNLPPTAVVTIHSHSIERITRHAVAAHTFLSVTQDNTNEIVDATWRQFATMQGRDQKDYLSWLQENTPEVLVCTPDMLKSLYQKLHKKANYIFPLDQIISPENTTTIQFTGQLGTPHCQYSSLDDFIQKVQSEAPHTFSNLSL